jgi:predicted RNA-binding Zn ribbon-like protein
MVNKIIPDGELKLESGRLCLDYANTAEWHASENPTEHIESYDALVSWARETGLVSRQEAGDLLQQASRLPQEAQKTHEMAVSLREAIYHIFSALAHGYTPNAEDMETLNRVLAIAREHTHLAHVNGSFTWLWADPRGALDAILWPVAISTAEMLTSDELERVKECADDRGCGWLFLDMSRNHSRQWCDMKGCGNRAKARRHYQRVRGSATGSDT